MSYGVTPTGFVRPTLAELKAEMDAEAQVIWPGIDIEADGKYGQLAGLWLKKLSDAWDSAQDVYTSRNINQASGAALDDLLAELNVTRIDASSTTISNVLLWGDNATTIPAGSKARISASKQDFSLESSVTISDSNARSAIFELATPSGSTTYTVVLSGNTYTRTSTSRDTAGAGLVSDIEAGSLGVSASYSDGILTVDGTTDAYTSVDFAISGLVNISIADGGLASAGIFICDTEGSIAAPANTLDTIMTPYTGWDSVSNPLAGATGRLAETDAEFRARAMVSYATGRATDETIRQAIFNLVSGVVSCSVESNRSDIEDDEGRPPHSFEVLVEGGDVQQIAQVIWDYQPSGIRPWGRNVTRTVYNSQNKAQTIQFSRPEVAYIWVKVKRSFNTEEAYPVDGDLRIKNAIVSWALSNYRAGANVYRRALMTPVNTVPGIADVTILLGNTINGSTPSAYGAVDIAIGSIQLPEFDVTRIIVEAL